MIVERRDYLDGGGVRVIEFYAPGSEEFITRLHPETADCYEHGCVIHSPTPYSSANPLGEAAMNWRDDKGQMERLCRHGIGHPDYDQANYNTRTGHPYSNIHGCDGCCA